MAFKVFFNQGALFRPGAALMILLAIASWIILRATQWGIGLSPDSTSYIGVARSIIEGNGVYHPFGGPLVHHPLLYPLLLACGGLLSLDPLNWARPLHGFLFATNAALVGLIFYRSSGRSWPAFFIGAALLLSSPTIFSLHTMAWSEPLFLFLVVSGFVVLAEYLARPTPVLLFCSATLLGLAYLARYVGGSFLVAAGLSLWFFLQTERVKKIKTVLAFGLITAIPIGVWFIRNFMVAHTATGRRFAYHPITVTHFNEALSTLTSWLIPPFLTAGPLPVALQVSLLAGLIAIYLLLLYRQHYDHLSAPADSLPYFSRVAFVASCSYCFFLVISVSFFDDHTPLNHRILSPLYIFGLAGFVSLLFQFCPYFNQSKHAFGFLLIVCILFGLVQAIPTKNLLESMYAHGRGFSSKSWKLSSTMEAVKTLPPDTPIYSNAHDAIYILANRDAKRLPVIVQATTRKENENYESQISAMTRRIRQDNGVVVYMDLIKSRWYLPTEQALTSEVSLEVLYGGADGTIYQAAPSSPVPPPKGASKD